MLTWLYGLYVLAKVKAAAILTKKAWDRKCLYKLGLAIIILLVPGAFIVSLLYGATLKLRRKSKGVSNEDVLPTKA